VLSGIRRPPMPPLSPCPQFLARLEERINPRKDVPGAPPLSPSGAGGAGTGPVGISALRAQLLRLCQGMRGVVLSFGDDAQLAASIDFLRRTHPLNHTAAVKKSQVHHALCEMLADVLRPLVRANQPTASAARLSPGLLAEWHSQVRRPTVAWGVRKQKGAARRGHAVASMLQLLGTSAGAPESLIVCLPVFCCWQVLRVKNEIGQWVNKHSKHINVGPLTCPLCAGCAGLTP
jgi:hypothetical protein